MHSIDKPVPKASLLLHVNGGWEGLDFVRSCVLQKAVAKGEGEPSAHDGRGQGYTSGMHACPRTTSSSISRWTPSPQPPRIYQLRIVLREISPLIWRRLLVCSDSTLAQLHTILQIILDWSGEDLCTFHIHGKDYGSNGADTRHIRPSTLRLRRGERFRYVYDYSAYWQCGIRLEAMLPRDPARFYPVCIGAARLACRWRKGRPSSRQSKRSSNVVFPVQPGVSSK